MKYKKRLAILISLMLVVLSSFSVQANGKHDNGNGNGNGEKDNSDFSDVATNHWAYAEIMLMSQLGIINGYEDCKFKPDSPVTRQEFAKMMVLTLGLDLINPKDASFLDVKKGDWAYKYVETSKLYLTGYQSSQGLNFKPTQNAQREDMAVAIIKGLKIDASKTDLSVLNNLADQASISVGLRKYVAAAINQGIMLGDNNHKFNPTATLTRAEAAKLLARLIQDEKVTFDEDKVVIDDDDLPTTNRMTNLTSTLEGNKVILDWTIVEDDHFKSYKVVASKNDSTPSFPQNGYTTTLSNVNVTGYEVEAGDPYIEGDFGSSMVAGQTYYVSITAVYDDANVTSNVIQVTIPPTIITDKTPVLSQSTVDGKIKLTWTNPNATNFSYYVIALSRYNERPKSPEDGFLDYLVNQTTINYTLIPGTTYNGGDFTALRSGQRYYTTITAYYTDGSKYTSNVVQVTLP